MDVLGPFGGCDGVSRDVADIVGSLVGVDDPEPGGSVVTAAGEEVAVGAEHDGVHGGAGGGKSGQVLGLMEIGNIPQPHGLVGGAGGEEVAVGCERDVVDVVGGAGEYWSGRCWVRS